MASLMKHLRYCLWANNIMRKPLAYVFRRNLIAVNDPDFTLEYLDGDSEGRLKSLL